MVQKNKQMLILWARRIASLLTILAWTTVLYMILRNGGTFRDQAPQCIISTMLIFGVLTGIYKGLEIWEKRA